MPFVRIPPDSIEPGSPPPFDVFDHRGRLLCRAWATVAIDERWPLWGTLFTTATQLEAYKRRFIQEAKRVIDDPKAKLSALIDLHVRPPQTNNFSGGYRTPGQRHVDKLQTMIEAVTRSLGLPRSSWTDADLEGLMSASVDIYSMLSEQPEISMIVARREIQLSVSAAEAAAGLYCYMLASASWIGSSANCSDEMKRALVPFAVLARIHVMYMREQSRLKKHAGQPNSELPEPISAFLYKHFNMQVLECEDDTQLLAQEVSREEVLEFLMPAYGLIRLQCERLAKALERWDFALLQTQIIPHDGRVIAMQRRLNIAYGEIWPGDFVELAAGDVGVVAGMDARNDEPIVLRLIAADGVPLSRPMKTKPDNPGHRIRRRLDSNIPRLVFDPRLVADVVL